MLRALFFMFALLTIAAAAIAPQYFNLANPHRLYQDVALVEKRAPQLEIRQLPDFSVYGGTADKKQAFFSFLAPLVAAENAYIEEQRQGVQTLYTKWRFNPTSLTPQQVQWLANIAKEYRVEFDYRNNAETAFELLLRRVDVVPETLVLVQAANESGWGTSRFALQALNLFGQWCFTDGCGLVPESRGEQATHEVQRFPSVNASIRSYLRNLNTHPAYVELRQLREQQRQKGRDIRALDLTPGLAAYSERGEAYIEELNAMIRVNRPLILDALREDPRLHEGPVAEPDFPASSNSAPE
ncbi:peptidoglycan hydrolase [Pseudidiomarina sediminum]|uniref:Peptidoglycan hydrolase n=1 Tax=Pseudidiomarina sediminum TaxID=431675 RepID=A0A432Z7V0_9GAMM|nr:glucosaminidase domain-containing protein [Pseudidiomarina sediminum]MBY6063102.1 glucosaminidase domain-containing protein [Pseudidiomarina sediminum]RUO73955.1 peptidoglycan hydrolase [Pseudidiomarina sediminum]